MHFISRASFIIVLITAFLFSTSAGASVTISGQITNPKSNKVYIRYYKEYLTYQVGIADSAQLDKSGSFSMTFNWPVSYPAELLHGEEATPLFLSPGYDLKVTLDAKQFDKTVKYTGKGADVNNYLALKTALTQSVSAMVMFKMPEKEFTHSLDSAYRSHMDFFTKWFAKADKKDVAVAAFINYQQAELTYTWAIQKEYYPSSYTYFTRTQQTVPATYYDFLKEAPLHNADAFLSPAYLRFAQHNVYKQTQAQKMLDSTANETGLSISVIDKEFTGQVKEYLYVQQIKSLLEKRDANSAYIVFERYKTFAKSKAYLEILQRVFAVTENLIPGKEAPNFAAVDLEGKKVQLSDYRGKLVYVDVWASWCGPCVREIPYAEKLQEELKGKDIIFLCVSVDENENSWKNIVKQKNIGGTHVRSYNEANNVSTLYNIDGIPHYLIIDKNGKIVDNNAKRPSQGVKADLEELLK